MSSTGETSTGQCQKECLNTCGFLTRMISRQPTGLNGFKPDHWTNGSTSYSFLSPAFNDCRPQQFYFLCSSNVKYFQVWQIWRYQTRASTIRPTTRKFQLNGRVTHNKWNIYSQAISSPFQSRWHQKLCTWREKYFLWDTSVRLVHQTIKCSRLTFSGPGHAICDNNHRHIVSTWSTCLWQIMARHVDSQSTTLLGQSCRGAQRSFAFGNSRQDKIHPSLLCVSRQLK